jgi:hypothetical protein
MLDHISAYLPELTGWPAKRPAAHVVTGLPVSRAASSDHRSALAAPHPSATARPTDSGGQAGARTTAPGSCMAASRATASIWLAAGRSRLDDWQGHGPGVGIRNMHGARAATRCPVGRDRVHVARGPGQCRSSSRSASLAAPSRLGPERSLGRQHTETVQEAPSGQQEQRVSEPLPQEKKASPDP